MSTAETKIVEDWQRTFDKFDLRDQDLWDVNQGTITRAPKLAIEYAQSYYAWIQGEVEYFRENYTSPQAAKSREGMAEEWKLALENVENKNPEEQDWTQMKNSLLFEALCKNTNKGVEREQARFLMVLAASLPINEVKPV